MHETVQLEHQTDEDGEPPSPFYDQLLGQVDRHDGPIRYSSVVLGENRTHITFVDGSIMARLGRLGYLAYASLDHNDRQTLEGDIEAAMNELAGDEDARALCNHAPILFEPTAHAMLLGARDDDAETITLEAHDVTFEQRRILVGGLAVLLARLEPDTSSLV